MMKINYITAVILLATASAAHAQTTTAPLPGDQGIASVQRNQERKQENKGLQNAAEQLELNQAKHAEQAEKKEQKREQHMEKHTERVEARAERREAAARPARTERPAK